MPQSFDLSKWVRYTDKKLNRLCDQLADAEKRASLAQHQTDTLAYHVDAYESMVQGQSIRPERAVPAIIRDPKTGVLYVNEVKKHVKTYVLHTNPQVVTMTALGTTTARFTAPTEQGLEGATQIVSFMLASATSMSIKVRIRHVGLDRYLMNAPVWIGSVFSDQRPGVSTQNTTGNQPKVLRVSIFLENNQDLIIDFIDCSGAPNQCEVYALGNRYFPGGMEGLTNEGIMQIFLSRPDFPYWLTSDQLINFPVAAAPPPAAAADPITFTVDRAFNFEAMEVHRYTAVLGAQTLVPFHATIREGMNSLTLVDNVDWTCFGGNGNFPMPWFESYLLARGAPLTGRFTNDSNLADATLDVVFHGRGIPVTLPGQRTLVPGGAGQGPGSLPPSQWDLRIPRPYSVT